MENIINNLSMILLVVAIICTAVSIITQMTKEIGVLNKIPTMLQVLVLSMLITVITFIAICQYKNYVITWYMVFGAIIGGVFIAYITAKGWDAFIDLFTRFYKREKNIKDLK